MWEDLSDKQNKYSSGSNSFVLITHWTDLHIICVGGTKRRGNGESTNIAFRHVDNPAPCAHFSGNYRGDWWVDLFSMRGEWKHGEWQLDKHPPPLLKTPVTMKCVLTITT